MTQDEILQDIQNSAATIAGLSAHVQRIETATRLVVSCLRMGGTIFTAGNGGSAAEAMHLAEECVGRFRSSRVPLPAMALVADPTALTCIGNDFGFDHVFSRPLEALGKPGDLLILFSTSGQARNLRLALDVARSRDVKILSILGRDGGPLRNLADVELIVEAEQTARIQEAHQVILHLLLQAIEEAWSSCGAS